MEEMLKAIRVWNEGDVAYDGKMVGHHWDVVIVPEETEIEGFCCADVRWLDDNYAESTLRSDGNVFHITVSELKVLHEYGNIQVGIAEVIYQPESISESVKARIASEVTEALTGIGYVCKTSEEYFEYFEKRMRAK